MIGIKDFNIPLNCGECSLAYGSDRDWSGHCPFLQNENNDVIDKYDDGNKRHPKCPLIEIQ